VIESEYGKGFTPLHIAARNGQRDIAQLLISRGADVFVQDEGGKTPWFWAQEYHHEEIAAMLPQQQYDW